MTRNAGPGGYVKLYSTILTSSIWLESHTTLRVWITMLALADRNGEVAASVGGLAHIANVSREECDDALQTLSSADPDSRTEEHNGRRIEKIAGGWLVLNAEKYRDLRTETQIEWAEKKKRWREEKERDKDRAMFDAGTPSDTSGDIGDMSEDKPIASSSSSSSSSSSTAKDVVAVVAREATRSDPALSPASPADVGKLSRLLTTRINQGMQDNPATEFYTPIPHGHGASLAAAEKISQAEVDPVFAADLVYASARSFKPDARSRQIRSVGYYADAVITAWERHQADTEARGASRPAAGQNNQHPPPPRNSANATDRVARGRTAIGQWLAEQETTDAEVLEVTDDGK